MVGVIVAQSVTGPIDTPTSQVIVAAFILIGTIVTAASSRRRAERDPTAAPTAPAAATPQAGGPPLTSDIDFVQYVLKEVDTAVERATRGLRSEIAELRGQFQSLRAVLRHTREAFREYIREWREYERQVRETWGATGAPPTPPVLTARIRDLLAEDDLDGTFSAAEVAERVGEARASDRDAAPQPPSSTEWG
jgi:hypothetical protein